MSNPLTETLAFLNADVSNLPTGATFGTKFPSDAKLAATYVQFAWDGTPADADNREDAAVRITVWGPKGHLTETQDVAHDLRKRLLAWSSANVQRISRGTGRLPGIDPDTGLPFCTFTVNAVLTA